MSESEVFKGYERQYCELWANLSRQCCTIALLTDQVGLSTEQKQQKITEIQARLDEEDILLLKMDLEARSLPPNVKAMLLGKLREYTSYLTNLRGEVKRISLLKRDQSGHEELLEAMKVYDQAIRAAPASEKLSMYEVYITRVAEVFGVLKTRGIYEQAIQSGLPDKDVKTMCMEYAELEKSCGEIDRSRAIYTYAYHFADWGGDFDFWDRWLDFEVKHGNADTLRDLVRKFEAFSACYSKTLRIPEADTIADFVNKLTLS